MVPALTVLALTVLALTVLARTVLRHTALARVAFLLAALTLLLAPFPAAPARAQAAPFVAGDTAVVAVDGPGDCLRIRDVPALSGQRVDCAPHGARVTVLGAPTTADGLTWQQVTWSPTGAPAITGWVATQYLAPPGTVISPPDAGTGAAVGCAAAATRGGLSGPVAPGATTINTTSGGTVEGIEIQARAQGCAPVSVWVNRPGGGFTGYLFGAPDFVNRAWLNQFPGGRIPAGTPLLLVCGSGTTAARQSALRIAPFRAGPTADGTPAPAVGARAAIVIDDASATVLHSVDGDLPLAPASLTKIVTAVLAVTSTDLDAWVRTEVGAEDAPHDSSLMGLRRGDCFRVRDLLYGLMLPSGNDAALALARYQAGTDAAFVQQMNTLAALLGLGQSSFIDPHGIGGRGHAMSARDLGMLTRYAMSLPEFREIVAAGSWTARGERTLQLWNVNRFLGSYPGADGVKTGFTEAAGRTLVASAMREGRRVYVVLLNSPDRVGEATALFDWAFDHHTWPATS